MRVLLQVPILHVCRVGGRVRRRLVGEVHPAPALQRNFRSAASRAGGHRHWPTQATDRNPAKKLASVNADQLYEPVCATEQTSESGTRTLIFRSEITPHLQASDAASSSRCRLS